MRNLIDIHCLINKNSSVYFKHEVSIIIMFEGIKFSLQMNLLILQKYKFFREKDDVMEKMKILLCYNLFKKDLTPKNQLIYHYLNEMTTIRCSL